MTADLVPVTSTFPVTVDGPGNSDGAGKPARNGIMPPVIGPETYDAMPPLVALPPQTLATPPTPATPKLPAPGPSTFRGRRRSPTEPPAIPAQRLVVSESADGDPAAFLTGLPGGRFHRRHLFITAPHSRG
jgi:hypothetical protein